MNVTRSSNVSISNYENGLSFALDQKMGRSPGTTLFVLTNWDRRLVSSSEFPLGISHNLFHVA